VNFLPAAVVTDRIQEAHQNESAPLMMLFPGYHPLSLSLSLPFNKIKLELCSQIGSTLIYIIYALSRVWYPVVFNV